MEILRVMYKDRRINTVNGAVKKFCLLSEDGKSFIHPRREHILTKQVRISDLCGKYDDYNVCFRRTYVIVFNSVIVLLSVILLPQPLQNDP